VAQKLKNYLERHPEINRKLKKQKGRIFYSTDLTENFKILGTKFFGQKIEVQKAKLN
jgi:glutamate racemase